ncbi:NmrA/HSCARG family protein [Chryseobacterium sp.]|uniref:NmrA/HSCARG family protein n=1 Tax=Chryseobacterium sp. TaxID=1871047 RepID=UPI00321A9CB3
MKSDLTEQEKAVQNDKPLVTIVGVLGKQGLSVAKTLLKSGRYRVRGITRRTHSPEAIHLAKQGMELVNLPLDLGYKKDYVEAFQGSYGVFMMTPNIIPPATHELELGKELADAVVEAGVQHIVFSSLENVEKITNGEKFAPHFTDKAKVEEYIRTLSITSSFIYLSFFYTNLLEFYTPKVQGDTLLFPIYLPKDLHVPFVDPLTATGPAVLEILSNPTKYAGKSLPVIGDIISPQEIVDTFIQVTGKKAVYSSAFSQAELLNHFPEFESNETLVQEILGMTSYVAEYGYFRKDRDMNWSRKLNPTPLTWKQFLLTTNWKGEKQSF